MKKYSFLDILAYALVAFGVITILFFEIVNIIYAPNDVICNCGCNCC